MAGHPDGEVGDDPVGAVLGDDRDTAALGQVAPPQPTGGPAGLLASFPPSQLLDPSTAERLDQVALVRVTGFTLEKNVKRQTDCISHRASSFVLFVGDNQALAWSTIPRTRRRRKLRNVANRQ
ncbi:hypothetical protein D3C84_1087990 [compost metagenome]